MGRYLDILRQAEAQGCDISDISDKRISEPVREVPEYSFGRFSRTFSALEARCPDWTYSASTSRPRSRTRPTAAYLATTRSV